MVWAYVKNKIERKWFMNYDDDKFADIAVIAKFLGRQISLHLTAIHALGGCDTTSFFTELAKYEYYTSFFVNQIFVYSFLDSVQIKTYLLERFKTLKNSSEQCFITERQRSLT